MWESRKVTLACGCLSNIPWNDSIIFTIANCNEHGETYVVKASRIFEAKTTRSSLTDFTVGEETESPTRREPKV